MLISKMTRPEKEIMIFVLANAVHDLGECIYHQTGEMPYSEQYVNLLNHIVLLNKDKYLDNMGDLRDESMNESQDSREMLKAYRPQQADQAKIQDIQRMFESVAHQCQTLPNGRYKSLALTALEEASMWAVKAETHQE